MKKQLLQLIVLAISAVSLSGLHAQVASFDSAAWGFEKTAVSYGGATGNIVEAWTQVNGFTQSPAQKHSGSFSMEADFSAVGGLSTAPKLQTFRSNTNKEGNFDILSPGNYQVSAWFYVTNVTTTGVFKLTVQKNGETANAVTFDLTTLPAGTWTQVSVPLTIPSFVTDGTAVWSSINFPSTPTNTVFYVDDINVSYVSSLATTQNTLERVAIYPNPVSDFVTINAPDGSAVQIYNALGAVVKSISEFNASKTVSISDLSAGLYLVKVSNNGKVYQDKIVKK
ncbi:T9SS type A sorting domain-containing protein [Flavobacterium algicola]|uniref:T9SS type A sorting domain-containing protein n=1 Tax=Flavobacterium algicola TaxID=556529 RepID=UPI001EFD6DC1|nr:T9SS type A sorting domain-containing protein [Flavobacterium algicola]MCG9793682.1 T9SS type A sorting domain-containing protein [Flavobacterium algicola]